MKYFLFELKDIMRRSWLPVLLAGLTPVFLFIMVSIYASILEIDRWKFNDYAMNSFIAMTVSSFFFLLFPIRTFGKITDKKYGSQYLMIPASGTSKFLSAAVISVVIVPLIFSAVYFLSDAAIVCMFPGHVESSQFGQFLASANMFDIIDNNNSDTVMSLRVYLWSPIFLPYMVSAAGLCGALLFKNRKGSKTFMTAVISFILVWLTGALVMSKMNEECEPAADFVEQHITLFWTAFQSMAAVCCLIYAYHKIKTEEL